MNLSSENNNVILKQTKKDFFLEFSKESEPLFNNFFIDDFYYQKEENLCEKLRVTGLKESLRSFYWF